MINLDGGRYLKKYVAVSCRRNHACAAARLLRQVLIQRLLRLPSDRARMM